MALTNLVLRWCPSCHCFRVKNCGALFNRYCFAVGFFGEDRCIDALGSESRV